MTPLKALNNVIIYSSPNVNLCEETNTLREVIKALEILTNVFNITVTEIQGYKYLSISNPDIRRPDTLIPISEEEYKIFDEVLE